MKNRNTLAIICSALVAVFIIAIYVNAQISGGNGPYPSAGVSSGNIGGGTTLPSSFTTIWDTNTGFLLYYSADSNVGNTNTGTLWTWSGSSSVGYTNGLIAYSNLFVVSSNQWIIYSNGTPLYSSPQSASTTYGSLLSGYSKGKGMFGGTPAPVGFGFPYYSWIGGAGKQVAPVMWAGVTQSVQQTCVTSSVPIYAPNFIASAGIMVGSNCTYQIPGTEPAGSSAFYPMVILGGFNDVAAGQLDSIISSGTCTNFDLNAAIIASSSCTMLKGLGDDFILGGENVLQQNLGSSVCGTIACFGVTNFSTGTSVIMGSQGSYMDGGCVNFVALGQFGCYDDVNVGFASGTYQTNGGAPTATGAAPNSGIYDLGNGNTITTSDTVFLGFTNQGVKISGDGSMNLANSNTITSVGTPVTGMTLWISNSSDLLITWTNGLTYQLANLAAAPPVPFALVSTNFISGWVYSNTFGGPIAVTATVTNQTTAAALMELRVSAGFGTGVGLYTNMVTLSSGMTNATMYAAVPPNSFYTFTNSMGTAGVRFGQLQQQ